MKIGITITITLPRPPVDTGPPPSNGIGVMVIGSTFTVA